MNAKRKAGAVVVAEGAAHAVLRRGAARELEPEEEKVMRMRLGAALDRTVPLERVGQGDPDLVIELVAFEIEAFMKLREGRGRNVTRRAAPDPQPSRTKEKIVRALRKKG
jgi:hypothetical protein